MGLKKKMNRDTAGKIHDKPLHQSQDDGRCCRCPLSSTRRRYEYNDESSSFESRESSRDFHERHHPYAPPRGDSRRRDVDFDRRPSEFPPSPRRRTYDWAPPPPRRYSSHRHRPPPSPRAVGPYHARGAAPGQRQGGCLNQVRFSIFKISFFIVVLTFATLLTKHRTFLF